MYTAKDHTFVICAYKESPYLEKTIQSILGQTVLGNVLISTSTPNDYVCSLAEKYHIPLKINDHHGTLGEEWNFGYDQAKTPLVTLAHQDDYYEPEFLGSVLDVFNGRSCSDKAMSSAFAPAVNSNPSSAYAINSNPVYTPTTNLNPASTTDIYLNPASNLNLRDKQLISFTDYFEIRGEKRVYKNTILAIKRILLFWMRLKGLQASRFFKLWTLRFGNPICCPSITYNKGTLGPSIFNTTFVNSLDYLELVELAKMPGFFLYIDKPLMGHRIHEESATTKNIADSSRRREDFQIFEMLWPRWIAHLIAHFYAKSEESNIVLKN